ncbi:hypothetical protein LTR49_025423 [Elasticomyces elasticus]|nr:hypothetical protein LTR49_025423 [Elasticomyces elasticus]
MQQIQHQLRVRRTLSSHRNLSLMVPASRPGHMLPLSPILNRDLTRQNNPGDPVQADPGAATTHVPGYSLASGHAATLPGQIISAASFGLGVVGSTADFPNNAQETHLPQTAVASAGESTSAATQLASGVVAVAGTTLSAGGPDMTVGDQTLSAVSSGLVVDGSSVTFSADALHTVVLDENGSQITATQLDSGTIPLGQMTISIGGPAATFGGKTLSAASGGLIVDGSIAAFSTNSQGTSIVAFGLDPKTALVTAGSSTYTAIEQPSSVVIAGKTLIMVVRH